MSDRTKSAEAREEARAFSLFSTPVFVFPLAEHADLRAELRARLLAEREASPGVLVSNRGGWHSRPDLAQRSEPCFQRLMTIVIQHVRTAFVEVARAAGADADRRFRYAVHGWAMILCDGGYIVAHDHADAHWSIAYYVDAGDADPETDPDSGALAFLSPVGGAGSVGGTSLFPSTFTVRPRDGVLVVFPGWLQHYVHPYRGTRPRISVSCNVRMELALRHEPNEEHSP